MSRLPNIQNNKHVFLPLALVVLCFLLSIVSTPGYSHGKKSHYNQPHFIVSDEKRNKLDVTALRGKVIFINFFTMTCIPCLQELPSIGKFYHLFSPDTNFLMLVVDVNDDLTPARDYMNSHNIQLPLYRINTSTPASWFRGLLPTTLFVDKKGRVSRYYEGSNDYTSAVFISFTDSLLHQ